MRTGRRAWSRVSRWRIVRGKGTGRPLTVEIGAARRYGRRRWKRDRRGLELSSKDGEAAFRYAGLTAKDATGRELRSWLEVQRRAVAGAGGRWRGAVSGGG